VMMVVVIMIDRVLIWYLARKDEGLWSRRWATCYNKGVHWTDLPDQDSNKSCPQSHPLGK
jgi:hypothetical protein